MLRTCIRPALLLTFFVLSCGKTEEEASANGQPESAPPDMTASTAYGSVAEVSAYLNAINPHIETIGGLQKDYEEALASSRQGASERRGTGRNLAEKAASIRPGLQSELDALDAIQPPPLLAPFHRDTRKMLATRIDALRRVIAGWELEQAGGDCEAVYQEAEDKYESANQLILQLNTQMNRINTSLKAALGSS
ncbi:MAG: hypothetical protein VCF24_25230 [Candidatus Latescibacterota bacterium]